MEKKEDHSKAENSEQNELQEIGDTEVNVAADPKVIIHIEQDGEGPSIEILEMQPDTDKVSEDEEKAKEIVLDLFTEMQIADIVQGRQREQWVFTDPTGEALDYTPNRNVFVRKVFGICFVMLLVTFVFTVVAYNSEAMRDFNDSKVGLIIFFCCLIMVCMIDYVLICSACGRAVPCNYISLVIGTGSFSYVVGFITAKYLPEVVMAAVGITLATVALCFLLALTSFDFTKYLLVVIVASVAISLATITCVVLKFAFGFDLTTAKIILLILASLISAVCLIIEFQMILGGKDVELGEDDYACGAWLIYSSIIQLFLRYMNIVDLLSN